MLQLFELQIYYFQDYIIFPDTSISKAINVLRLRKSSSHEKHPFASQNSISLKNEKGIRDSLVLPRHKEIYAIELLIFITKINHYFLLCLRPHLKIHKSQNWIFLALSKVQRTYFDSEAHRAPHAESPINKLTTALFVLLMPHLNGIIWLAHAKRTRF